MITFQARTERAWASIYIHKIYRTCSHHHTREDWMICRGPGFLAVVYDSAPRPSPAPPFVIKLYFCRSFDGWAYWRGGRRVAWSRSIRPQESLALYKSFNTLCITHPLFSLSASFAPKENSPSWQGVETKKMDSLQPKISLSGFVWLCKLMEVGEVRVVGLVVYVTVYVRIN